MTLIEELKNLDRTLQTKDLDTLIDKMLDNIGSVDPELRDTLIFNTFGKLILNDYLTTKQMERIIEVCLKNLYFNIGQREDDSVFMRSFSALVIGLILRKDRQKRFLSDVITMQAIESSVEYLKLEKDIRGYVDRKGWAHSIAHGADLLADAIKHPNYNTVLSSKCLETIKHCLFKDSVNGMPYIDDEEERLIFAVEALLEKGVTESDIEMWVLTISEALTELSREEGYSLNFFTKRHNLTSLLRGLYFRSLYRNDCLKLRESIVDILEKWHNQLYHPVQQK